MAMMMAIVYQHFEKFGIWNFFKLSYPSSIIYREKKKKVKVKIDSDSDSDDDGELMTTFKH